MNIKTRLLALGLSGVLLTGGVLVATGEGEVLRTYVDPAGIETACFGQTGHNIKLGMVFTHQQCLDMLASSLKSFDRELVKLTPPLSEGEHIAYLSFIYNIGAEAFGASTLRKKLWAGDRVGACNELPRWVYAKGKKLPGLVKRRSNERRYCLRDL
ncbi:lysozyme [Shewanella sp. S1-58-MNA-CIBAN-0166]|uniref:lysozyme n=1 Tax=Shewanella sp. S1-58-MNA-CIBAN-0166 TaxID=3140467 RepID=UPI00333286DC